MNGLLLIIFILKSYEEVEIGVIERGHYSESTEQNSVDFEFTVGG
ncbi:hypothetical protein RI065_06770 [Mycoplasmatota bacterium zrk1]